MEILRAFPEVVIAGFFLAILSLGPIPAIIAVVIHTVGALGKMFFEVVENADMKPDEGLRAVGANWVERVWFGIVPQVLPNFMSYFLLRLEINVRASTIIGAVGGGGIGEPLRLSISQRPRGQDARDHLPAVLDDRRRRSVLGMAAPPSGRRAGLPDRARERLTMTHDDRREMERSPRRHPQLFRSSSGKRYPRRSAIAWRSRLPRSCWWFFSVGRGARNANWGIAGTYLADWVSYEVRPDIEFEDGT